MFPRNVTIAEAAQFTAASVADYGQAVRADHAALRAKVAKRSTTRTDIKVGLITFAVVFGGAVVALALNLI